MRAININTYKWSPWARWTRKYSSLKPRFRPASWRFTVGAGASVATLVLLVNLAFLMWSTSSLHSRNGLATAYSGSCETAKTATLWLHLAINILSTLLLSASNNCAQLMSSPCRTDVDLMHERGKWMTIGAPSLRNLAAIPRWRVGIWLLLYASSVPIHFMYNSIVFNTVSANTYQVYGVSRDIASENVQSLKTSNGSLVRLQELRRLTPGDCLQAYSHRYISAWGDVVLVINSSSNTTITELRNGVTHPGWQSISWSCQDVGTGKSHPCNFDNAKLAPGQNVLALGNYIAYCLAQPTQPHCKVDIAVSLLLGVVICNAIKVACFVTAIIAWKSEPLATIGDAISSFLTTPDLTTQGLGMLSEHDLRRLDCKARYDKRRRQSRVSLETLVDTETGEKEAESVNSFTRLQYNTAMNPATYHYRPQRWYHANELTGWWQLQIIALVIGLATIVFAAFYGRGVSEGFGAISTDRLWAASARWSLPNIVLVVNLSQLFLSTLYLIFNKILTQWLAAHACSKFASVRQPLRVSKPHREQNTTYYLQLPYKYSVPFLAAMATVHWTMSRSLFLIDITLYNDPVLRDGSTWLKVAGYSPQAIVVSFCILLAIVITLECLGFRKLDSGMPIIGLCTASISAACHPPEEEKDVALKPLMYGVMPHAGLNEQGHQRVGFSSEEVMPLANGAVYA